MDHLFNCHGEWTLVAQALATLPLVGPWVVVTLRGWLSAPSTSTPADHREPA